MQKLRSLLQFLKKHYEKIILSAVLLGLGATAVWFYGAVQEATQAVTATPFTEPPAKAWKSPDLTAAQAALDSFRKPPPAVLSEQHKLFNPVTWKKRRDGTLFKVLLQGAAALTVTDIRAEYYKIIYERQAGESFRMTTVSPSGRGIGGYSRLNERDSTKNYIITGTNAAADGTSTLTLSIIDTGETVTVTTNSPYMRIEGYEADLNYPPDSMVFTKRHVNDNLRLSDATYKIVAITNNAVTVQDTRSTQKTTIEWTGAH